MLIPEIWGEDAPAAFLVTIRVTRRNPLHDPQDKVTGTCPASAGCTGAAGEHHTLAALGTSAQAVRDAWNERGKAAGYRVTRAGELAWAL